MEVEINMGYLEGRKILFLEEPLEDGRALVIAPALQQDSSDKKVLFGVRNVDGKETKVYLTPEKVRRVIERLELILSRCGL